MMGLMLAGASRGLGAVDAPWQVWNAQLRMTVGGVSMVDASGVRMTDGHGLDVVLDNALAMIRVEEPDSDGGIWSRGGRMGSGDFNAMVVLTDGQRWEARFVDEVVPDDRVVLSVRLLGRVVLPLDVISSVLMAEGDRWPTVGKEPGEVDGFDRVELANGDVLRGTVLSLGREFEMEVDRGMVKVRRDAVRYVRLVNPERSSAPVRVWLASGQVLGARSVSGAGSLVFDAIGPTGDRGQWETLGRVDASAVVGVEFAPRRLVSLGSLGRAESLPEGGRLWAEQVRVNDHDERLGSEVVVLPGPMAARWTLPRRGVRASGEISLGRRSSAWADCLVRVEQGEVVLWEGRLSREEPVSTFSVGLGNDRSLTIRVLPGEYGPIDDVVEVRRGWVLLSDGESG